jgi:dipeptide transport system ATP-binding protein
MPLLEIEDLHVEFPSQGGVMHAVEGVSLTVEEGEVLGIVGESGSGKSVTLMALMGLIAFPGKVRAKKLRFAGNDLLGISDKERRRLVGKDMAMIFQEPTTSLNPCFTIGWQLVEALRLHSPLDKAGARRRAIELLEQVGIPAAHTRLDDYPHQA